MTEFHGTPCKGEFHPLLTGAPGPVARDAS